MTLDDGLRPILAALADLLVPAEGAMPGASDVGVAGHLVDEALRYRTDLAEPVATALRRCAGRDPEEALDRLAAEDPDGFGALALAVTGAYLLSPEPVRRLGIAVAPRGVADDVDSYVDLLAVVAERGFETRLPPGERA